eukprot:scaffold73318_cov75-Phaeocystis_antarctica.AAC.1
MPITPSAVSFPRNESHSLSTTSRAFSLRHCTSAMLSTPSACVAPPSNTLPGSPCVARWMISLLPIASTTAALVASSPTSETTRSFSALGSGFAHRRNVPNVGLPTTSAVGSADRSRAAARASSSITVPTDGVMRSE